MKKQNEISHDMDLVIDGMGIVLYSDGAVQDIEEGEDYYSKEFSSPEQVAKHIKKGDVIGFNTGSSGSYSLKFRSGYPSEAIEREYPISIRLAIVVQGGKLSVIDLFWLMEWSNDIPIEQQLLLEDGIYHVTISTGMPESGTWGDHQQIYLFLNRLLEMPELTWTGVPQLFSV
ncbi:hypothetical protein [Gorillibacterium sp. CAU 1737]|uniref:hypothetical protein n=1 Tax=Gorillibacterium sp. CAU 1737 TaxID=3140362 RepID=UPI003260C2FE